MLMPIESTSLSDRVACSAATAPAEAQHAAAAASRTAAAERRLDIRKRKGCPLTYFFSRAVNVGRQGGTFKIAPAFEPVNAIRHLLTASDLPRQAALPIGLL